MFHSENTKRTISVNYSVLNAQQIDGGYKPFIVEGQATGQLSELPGRDDVRTGVYRVQPGEYPDNTPADYCFETDEYIWVIEGSVDITHASGERTTLRAGDAAFFRAGSRSVWEFHAPFRKFSVEIEESK
jgi:uncharacterized cupin superfamily protein